MEFTELAEELFALKTRQYELGADRKAEVVSTGEDGVLYRLYIGSKDGVLAGDLARGMGLTSGRIANILRQLETKGYVVRSSGRKDRRQVNVVLTEAGREHIRKAYGANIQEMEQELQYLGEEDAKEYVRIYARLVEREAGGSED